MLNEIFVFVWGRGKVFAGLVGMFQACSQYCTVYLFWEAVKPRTKGVLLSEKI